MTSKNGNALSSERLGMLRGTLRFYRVDRNTFFNTVQKYIYIPIRSMMPCGAQYGLRDHHLLENSWQYPTACTLTSSCTSKYRKPSVTAGNTLSSVLAVAISMAVDHLSLARRETEDGRLKCTQVASYHRRWGR